MEFPRDSNQSSGALWDYGGLDGWPWQEYRMRYSPEVTVLFCIAYAAVFVVGFVGNISVVLVVYKNVRMQSSPTNIFIVNLAIADLLVIVVCVPFTLIGSITTAEEAEGDDLTIDRGPSVLGGKEKLMKLCSFLRTNVIDLINYYEIARRRVSGTYYTESENADLCSGLRLLKYDVEKLLDTLNEVGGHRSEIKQVLDMYKEQEARYRSLRLLNKGAKLRHQIENGTNDQDSNSPDFGQSNRLYKRVIGRAFTSAAQDKNINLT